MLDTIGKKVEKGTHFSTILEVTFSGQKPIPALLGVCVDGILMGPNPDSQGLAEDSNSSLVLVVAEPGCKAFSNGWPVDQSFADCSTYAHGKPRNGEPSHVSQEIGG